MFVTKRELELIIEELERELKITKRENKYLRGKLGIEEDRPIITPYDANEEIIL
jgi:hypothetical protein